LAAQMRRKHFGYQLVIIRKKNSELGIRHVSAP
jgi:hypothetical protein